MQSPSLEQRLDRLEAADAIRRMILRYQQACDSRDWSGYRDAYAPDARVIIQGGAGGVIEGNEAIARNAVDTFFATHPFTQHFFTNLDIEVTGTDSARGHGETILIARHEDAKADEYFMGGGSYDWTFVRIGSEWKFKDYNIRFHWSNRALGPIDN